MSWYGDGDATENGGLFCHSVEGWPEVQGGQGGLCFWSVFTFLVTSMAFL